MLVEPGEIKLPSPAQLDEIKEYLRHEEEGIR